MTPCVVLVDQRLLVLRGKFDCGTASLLYIYVCGFYVHAVYWGFSISTEIEWHPRPKSSLFSLIMAVGVLFMNLNVCLIRIPILLSQSFRVRDAGGD